jgi:hypothetical protein
MSQLESFEIVKRMPFADGIPFDDAGAYERIDGRAYFAADPASPDDAQTLNIALAPKDADGRVRFSIDVFLLQPVDPAKANGALFVEFPNRGNKRCLQFFNDAPGTNDPVSTKDAGNGFLMRGGYTIVCVGWQGDVLRGDKRLMANLPVAHDKGRALTARIRAEFICDAPGTIFLPLSGKTGTRSHPTMSLDPADAELRRRRYPWTDAEPISPDRWEFARVEGGGRAGAGDVTGAERAIIPSDSHIYLPEGFETGWIYELVYTARDPLVLDLGFLAVRDLIVKLRGGHGPGNPVRATIQRAYAWGRSQSGRILRDFLYRGYNAAPGGGKVFDGVLSHVAGAGRTTMTLFANLVVAASQQYEDWLSPADRFPFSYALSTDHITGTRDAILKRPATDPYVIHTQTASEYWYRRGSLVHTDTQGNDLPQPNNVRVYFWSSSQHWSDPQPGLPPKGICTNYQNIVATAPFFRATLALMEEWVRDGKSPPPSRYPLRADKSLVPMEEWRAQFPAISGIALPAKPTEFPFVDFGEELDKGGPIAEPPTVSKNNFYTVLVPAVDADGNDAAGLRAPMVAVPLGTYTGWNLRIDGYGAGALHYFSGSYIPFADSKDERLVRGDPRPSVEERYSGPRAYQVALAAAAQNLASERFLVLEDVARIAQAAANWGAPRHIVRFKGKDARN